MTTATPSTTTSMREPTLGTMGLGGVLDLFKAGRLPVDPATAVERVFGPAGDRGALVISGASGIVGAGKTMQLGSRLAPYGVPVVALDFPNAPDGIGQKYQGLVAAFGREGADKVIAVDVDRDICTAEELKTVISIYHRVSEIMAKRIRSLELMDADVVILPEVGDIHWACFSQAGNLILEGEKATREQLGNIRNVTSGLRRWLNLRQILKLNRRNK